MDMNAHKYSAPRSVIKASIITIIDDKCIFIDNTGLFFKLDFLLILMRLDLLSGPDFLLELALLFNINI